MSILKVENLNKEYDDFKLKDINFTIPYGSIVGLIGENGAGKTTTIKSILNIVNKDSGKIYIFGEEMNDKDILIRDRIGVVFDDNCFHDTLTPIQIADILSSAYSAWSDDIFYKYLNQFKIPKNKSIKELSKGMKMKFSIATVLAQQPALIILDEPTSGLDPVSRNEILEIFLDFVQNETCSILFSSHITTDLEKIADYIIFINKGEIVFSKSKDELIYDYGVIRCGEDAFNSIEKEDILAYRKMDYQYEILVEDRELAEKSYKHLDRCVIDNPSIDDIMLIYIKNEI